MNNSNNQEEMNPNIKNEVERDQEDSNIIGNSLIRFNRNNRSTNAIAVPLHDRRSRMIPSQPNHCLPILPAPLIPTRSSYMRRSQITPVLKLLRASDLVDEEHAKSSTVETNNDPEKEQGATLFPERSQEQKTSSKETNSVFETDRNSSSIDIVDHVKQMIADEESKKDGENPTKNLKKRKKSSDVKINNEKKTKRCNNKNVPTSTVVSGAAIDTEKKTVPPLRLKKVVQEGTNGDCGNPEVPSNGDENVKYIIVTESTPRSESQFTKCEHKNNQHKNDDQNINSSVSSKNLDISKLINDLNSKLLYKYSKLRNLLVELDTKATDLSPEEKIIADILNSIPVEILSPTHDVYHWEKQKDNIVKLIDKLSDKELEDINKIKQNLALIKPLIKNYSPISSPEPPKLLPYFAIDNQNISSYNIRNTPPVLHKVSLNIPSNLNILNEQGTEILKSPNESTCVKYKNNMAKILPMTDTSFYKNTTYQERKFNNSTDAGHRLTRPPILSSTSITPSSENVGIIENENFSSVINSTRESGRLNNIQAMDGRKKTMKELSKTMEVVSLKHSIFEDTEDTRRHEVYNVNNAIQMNHIKSPIINSVTGGSEISHNVRYNQLDATLQTQPIMKTQMLSTIDRMNIMQLDSNYYDSTLLNKNTLETNKMEDTKGIHKVPPSITQSRKTNYDSMAPIFNQIEYPFTEQHFSAQSNNSNRVITEQFPTLDNWMNKMSKKQVSTQKSTLQTVGNGTIGTIPVENPTRTSRFDGHEVSLNEMNTANGNALNITPQWNKEKWQHQQHHQQNYQHHQQNYQHHQQYQQYQQQQYQQQYQQHHQQHHHHHQRQQQQLFQHVSAGVTPLTHTSTTTLNTGIYTPLSTTQFYSNNYNNYPYNGATFGYQSTMYSTYNDYSYHSRLHQGTPMTNYHIPMQDTLNSPIRPLSHVDKSLSSLQNPNPNFTSDIFPYSGSHQTVKYQPPNDFDFNQLGITSTNNHNSGSNYLSSVLLSSSSLPSGSQQTLPHPPLSEYPANNNQYGYNRPVLDVVATTSAAAAAAAASIGKQRAPLPIYSQSTSTAINAVMEMNSTWLTSNTSNNRTGENLLSNQGQPINVGKKEPQWNNAGYRPIPNLLLENLPYVRTEHNFPSTSTFSNNIQDLPSLSTDSLPQMPNKASRSILRNNDKPYLGEVNKSSDTFNNLKCSNCGVVGAMLKCLGCDIAFYCNERCQFQHWNIHFETCPKRMPNLKN